MHKPMPTIVCALLATLVVVSTGVAGPLEDASAANKRGDYATALRLLRPLAGQGDMDAQTLLGLMYYNGQGMPQNYAEAAKWFRLAADHGMAYAQYSLGVMYEKGEGVPRNYAEL
jgi:TPR repeat protein